MGPLPTPSGAVAEIGGVAGGISAHPHTAWTVRDTLYSALAAAGGSYGLAEHPNARRIVVGAQHALGIAQGVALVTTPSVAAGAVVPMPTLPAVWDIPESPSAVVDVHLAM
jgi:hypothetical protein